MTTHSSTLAWRSPWMEESGRLHGVAKSQTRLSDFTFTFFLILLCHHSQSLKTSPTSTSSFFFAIAHELPSLVDLVIYNVTINHPPLFLAPLAHFG